MPRHDPTPKGSGQEIAPEVLRYQALVIRKGLEACKIGLRLNRDYTPKRLMEMASKITGHKFKARDFDAAIVALGEWAGV